MNAPQHSNAEGSKPTSGGKLGILLPGMGAVGTTLIAGISLIRKGLAAPVGSMTQMGRMPAGAGAEGEVPIRERLPLASLDDIQFAGWDVYDDSAFAAASKARVLEPAQLAAVEAELSQIRPMPAVFDRRYVTRLEGTHIKTEKTWWELAAALKEDILRCRKEQGVDRQVMVWCASTEVYATLGPQHQDLRSFEAAMKAHDPAITPSMVYAYAAISCRVPFANGAPNLCSDVPALEEFAHEMGVPLSGKDFKTGQTLMKTLIAPGLKARMLGLDGWFSTNILGNRDGEVLDDPASFKTKEMSKLSVLDSILEPETYPELYGNYDHKVRINYYKPRGDNKEGWDNIDIFGWLGYPMQVKIDFLCRDSILAAPLVLDLALTLDLAARTGARGVQTWQSFFFKAPMEARGEGPAVHDLFKQQDALMAALEGFAEHFGV